ncbi:MAG TPA: TlpA disulfide reductase family protein [Bacteroidales bacterium]|nr:TlpA disulfide reductase family protein [Bacteroidales bacterium]
MKKLLLFSVIAAFLAACSTTPKEPHYTLKGKIKGADSTQFYLSRRTAGKFVKFDSATVVKGEFTFTGGKVNFPEMVYFLTKDNRNGLTFFLENSDITIDGSLDTLYKAKITGSKAQHEYDSAKALIEPIEKKYSALYEIYQAAQKAGRKSTTDSIEKVFDDLQKESSGIQKEFIKNSPKSYASPTLLKMLSYEMEADEIESLIKGLDTTLQKTLVVKDLIAHIAVMKTVAIGQKAPDFTLDDPDGKPVPLFSKVGKTKLLLVDFWASWCGPCRHENPNVVKVWKEFHKMGFDVFSVSLDRPGDKDGWTNAIKNDQLTWTHVSDLKYWDCSAAKLYAVNAIPSNFLLDKNGIIIAKNVTGDKLRDKVKEELSKK